MVKSIIHERDLQIITIAVKRKSSGRSLDELQFVLGTDAYLEVISVSGGTVKTKDRNNLVSLPKAKEIVTKFIGDKLTGRS